MKELEKIIFFESTTFLQNPQSSTELQWLQNHLSSTELSKLQEAIQTAQTISELQKYEATIFDLLQPLEQYFLQPETASIEQISTMIWLLLRCSDILLAKAQIEPIHQKSFFINSLSFTATAVRLCEQVANIPSWLYHASLTQSEHILSICWQKEQEKLIGQNLKEPDFKTIVQWLAKERSKIKTHRQKLYNELHNQPLLIFAEYQKVQTTELPIYQCIIKNRDFLALTAKRLWQRAIELSPLTEVPCDYFIPGLGSIATLGIGPYSDFEYLIMVKENQKNGKISEKDGEKITLYFTASHQWLVRLFILLGETEFSFLLIKRGIKLNSPGFCLDTKVLMELFDTPQELAKACTESLETGEMTNLIRQSALSSMTNIFGNKGLLSEYMAAVKLEYSKNFLYQKRALAQLKIDCADFNIPKFKLEKGRLSKENKLFFDIKEEGLRLPFRVLSSLCLYFNLWPESADVWSQLDILKDTKKISPENYQRIRYLLSIVLELRFKAHSACQGEDNKAYQRNYQGDDAPVRRFELDDSSKFMMIECYCILMPLHDFATQFYESNGETNLFLSTTCYDSKTSWQEWLNWIDLNYNDNTTEIKLRDCSTIPIDTLCDLIKKCPNLKVLWLGNCRDFNKTHLNEILKVCPLLTDLKLVNMPALYNTLTIKNSNLERLTLQRTKISKLVLSTPSLTDLRCVHNPHVININNLPTAICSINVSHCSNLKDIKCKDFAAYTQLIQFKATKSNQLPFAKALSKFPVLFQYLGTENAFLIPQAAKHLENLTQSDKKLNLTHLLIKQCDHSENQSQKKFENQRDLLQQFCSDLENNDAKNRLTAATQLGKIGIITESIVTVLLEVLQKEQDKSVSQAIVKTLGKLGVTTHGVIEILLAVLQDSKTSIELSNTIIEVLGCLGAPNPTVIKFLAQMTDEKENATILDTIYLALGLLDLNFTNFRQSSSQLQKNINTTHPEATVALMEFGMEVDQALLWQAFLTTPSIHFCWRAYQLLCPTSEETTSIIIQNNDSSGTELRLKEALANFTELLLQSEKLQHGFLIQVEKAMSGKKPIGIALKIILGHLLGFEASALNLSLIAQNAIALQQFLKTIKVPNEKSQIITIESSSNKSVFNLFCG